MRNLILIVFLAPCLLFAQKQVVTVGIQYKPMIPANVLIDKEITKSKNGYDFLYENNFGYTAGMCIRMGLTDRWNIETGINYVKRNSSISFIDQSIDFLGKEKFSIYGYEIPTLGLVYIQLTEEIYMNTAFGLSLDFYPSDIGAKADEYIFIGDRRSWISPSILANVGWEYRTKESGIFYLGASFHRPFVSIYNIDMEYKSPGEVTLTNIELSGQYLTLDLRYFFHEEPKKKKAPKQPVKDLKYYQKLKKEQDKAAKKAAKNN